MLPRVCVGGLRRVNPVLAVAEKMVSRPLSDAAAEVDPLASLLPYSPVPHITGNFLSWGPPIPMLPVRYHRHDAKREPILSPAYNTLFVVFG